MESSSEAVSGYVSDGAKRRVIYSQLFVNRGSEFAATEPRRIVNRESRIVEAMKKPRPTTAATTTKYNKPEVRHGESVLYRIRDRRSVDQGQEAPLRPLPVGAVLVAEFLDEKFFFGTDPRDDGDTYRRG